MAGIEYESDSVSFGNPVVEYVKGLGGSTRGPVPLENSYSINPPSTTSTFIAPASNEAYSMVSGDFNPIRINPYFSDFAALLGTITHGMFCSAATRKFVEEIACEGHPERCLSFEANFTGMVLPGDVLSVRLRHIAMQSGNKIVKVETVNQRGEKVIEGSAEIAQPPTAFVFTGQGSQEPGMGMDLYNASATSKEPVGVPAATLAGDAREGLPLQGLRVAAGIPSTENAIAGLRASAQQGMGQHGIGEQEALDLDILTHAEPESSFFLSLCTARSCTISSIPILEFGSLEIVRVRARDVQSSERPIIFAVTDAFHNPARTISLHSTASYDSTTHTAPLFCNLFSAMPPHLPRDQPAFCHCSRCTMGGRSGKELWAEVRQQHLARDIEDVRLAEFHGYMVDFFQTQAISANRAAIKKDLLELAAAAGPIDEEGSENSEFGPEEDIPLNDATPIHGLSPSASPPPLLFPEQVSPLALAAEADFGDALEGLQGAAGTANDRSEDEEENDEEEDEEEEDDEEVANDEQEDGVDSSDDGLGDDDLSDVQDELEQEGGLFDGADGAESDTTQEEEEDEDDGAAGSREASPASEDEADPRITSRHSPGLFDRLVAGYTPGRKPRRPPNIHNSAAQLQSRLGRSEHASLAHFVTSIRTKATDDQYKAFARNAEKLSPGVKICGQKKAATLLKRVTKLREDEWDMCPNSCMAFTGQHSDLLRCKARRNGKRCREARFDSQGKPRKRFTTFSILSRIRARFAAGRAYTYLHDRGQLAAEMWGTDGQEFGDWADGAAYKDLRERGFFDDSRYDAFLLSTDGAQMVEKRKSNGWIVLLSSFNTPPLRRFKHGDSFIASVIPGPNNPIDLDSFLFPIMQEIARAALGYWVWDAACEEWFLWRAWLVAAAADQKGQAKLNHMTGPTGFVGCKACEMKANYSYKGQKVGYYPLDTVESEHDRTQHRPLHYDPFDLPMRNDDTYADDLAELDGCRNDTQRRDTRRETGVSGRPLLSASPAFTMPSFFPPDVFHLFGSNIPTAIWNALTDPRPGDPFNFTDEQKDLFGDTIEKWGSHLPSAIESSPPRNPNIFAGPRYKMYEWMMVVYTYLPPFLVSIDAPADVIEMVAHLAAGIRLALDKRGCSRDELARVQEHFVSFARLWEKLYIRGEPGLLFRATISLHHLLHIWQFIYCHGSVVATSQARCERETGLIKRALRSNKAPFASIENTCRRDEHLRLYDILLGQPGDLDTASFSLSTKLSFRHKRLTEEELDHEQQMIVELQQLGLVPSPAPPYTRMGKLVRHFGGGHSITVRGSRIESEAARKACFFASFNHDIGNFYSKAAYFILFAEDQNVPTDEDEDVEFGIDPTRAFVVHAGMLGVGQQTLGEGFEEGPVIRGSHWADDERSGFGYQGHKMLRVDGVLDSVGVMEAGGSVYILRPSRIPDAKE
ncbi:hypothetical protein OC844_005125 [Tilletia horrida]|nr:hypothetical protein OC844_005125 [Tilletia horrida]